MNRLNISRISDIALIRLGSASRFHLLSAFDDVINIDTDKGLISIQNTNIPLTPFAIIAEDSLQFHQLKNVLYDNPEFTLKSFPDTIVKNIEDAEIYTSVLAPDQERIEKIDLQKVETEIDLILMKNKSPDGFSDISRYITFTNDKILVNLPSDSSDLIRFVQGRLNLTEFSELPEKVTSLIGLGSGLTPSMDDFIVGLISVLTYFDTSCDLTLHREIVELTSAKLSATNTVSAAFLESAVNQSFAEPVLNLFKSFETYDFAKVRRSLENILEIGHSSGLDSLNGILFGMKLLKYLY